MSHFDPTSTWPTSIDLAIVAAFLGLALLVPALGYVFMVLDFRAYLRSLKRGLVRMVHLVPEVPEWARAETPRSIASFGLRMPCTEDDLKGAYRRLVKQLHPDHGGSERRFLMLQANFEEALEILHREALYHRWPAA